LNWLVQGQQQGKEAIVTNVTLDQALPVVRNLAERKANAFVRRFGFTINEGEDVQSQLLLSFLSRWPKFDSEMACIRTFASRVMDNELVSILRYRLAGRRRHIVCGVFLRDKGDADFGDACLAGLSITPRAFTEQQNFWFDIERALVPLPEVLLETAYALCWYTPSELSRVLGRSRTIVYERMRRLREALLAAGIGPDYFTTSGPVQ
jgi:DNA-directed RNA polymerase specialized sigma24 family protein